jgi:uncharacterized protein involved in exopolysaccharide biosynthesis
MSESNYKSQSSGFVGGLVPIIEGWKFVAGLALVAGLTAIAVVQYRGPQYRAEMSLVSVASSKVGNLGGGGGLAAAASLLGGGGGSIGLQSSPALVVKFADMDGVLNAVAMSPVKEGSPERVIERITGKPLSEIPENRIERIMRRYIHSSYDRSTGIININVTSKDSAIARVVATRIVAATRNKFTAAVRAQATELKNAQEQRVAVAEQDLARIESQMQYFLQANRQFQSYSNAAVEKDRLQRNVQRAQEVLNNAINDRESARSKELEDTPAVVVIDPLPARIPATEKHLGSITLVSAFVAGLFAMLLLMVRESFRSRLAANDEATVRLARSMSTLPVIGRAFRGSSAPRTSSVPAGVPAYPMPENFPPALARTGTGLRRQ